jgi:hypothetical protein
VVLGLFVERWCLRSETDDPLYDMMYNMVYLLTEIGLAHCRSSTVHIYTQTVQRSEHTHYYQKE